jgi:hypothetical protein
MNGDPFGTLIPKLAAYIFVLPLALLLLWFTWKQVAKARDVQAKWEQAEATALEVSGQTLTFEFPWRTGTEHREVRRNQGFSRYNSGDKFPIFVNPANAGEVRCAGNDSLWGGPIVTGIFGVLFLALGIFMLTLQPPKPPAAMMEEWAAMQAGQLPAASTAHAAPADDGSEIFMREPSESWKANVFWGLLFGLLLVVPPFFADADVPKWKRALAIAAGIAWMVFMGRSAIRNRGRTVQCNTKFIQVSDPFGTRSIPLSDVAKVTRRDVRKKLNEFDNIGRSRRNRELSTLPEMVDYIAYDAAGKELVRLDKNMEPHTELRRFLNRIIKQTGKEIADE